MGPKDRIIVALDVSGPIMAIELVRTLRDHVGMFKLGLEFITSTFATLVSNPQRNNARAYGAAVYELSQLRELFDLAAGKIFWDSKLADIPNTVAGASRATTRMQVAMFNVHCLGGLAMMEAAREARDEIVADGSRVSSINTKILGVTVLTSLDIDDLMKLGFSGHHRSWDPGLDNVDDYNKGYIRYLCANLAKLAKEAGLDGVISSPQEISRIRQECGPDFLIVTPGVRPSWAAAGDQKRIMPPGEAVKLGADYLVIGRPITNPPEEIGSPVEAAKRIADEIDEALA